MGCDRATRTEVLSNSRLAATAVRTHLFAAAAHPLQASRSPHRAAWDHTYAHSSGVRCTAPRWLPEEHVASVSLAEIRCVVNVVALGAYYKSGLCVCLTLSTGSIILITCRTPQHTCTASATLKTGDWESSLLNPVYPSAMRSAVGPSVHAACASVQLCATPGGVHARALCRDSAQGIHTHLKEDVCKAGAATPATAPVSNARHTVFFDRTAARMRSIAQGTACSGRGGDSGGPVLCVPGRPRVNAQAQAGKQQLDVGGPFPGCPGATPAGDMADAVVAAPLPGGLRLAFGCSAHVGNGGRRPSGPTSASCSQLTSGPLRPCSPQVFVLAVNLSFKDAAERDKWVATWQEVMVDKVRPQQPHRCCCCLPSGQASVHPPVAPAAAWSPRGCRSTCAGRHARADGFEMRLVWM